MKYRERYQSKKKGHNQKLWSSQLKKGESLYSFLYNYENCEFCFTVVLNKL